MPPDTFDPKLNGKGAHGAAWECPSCGAPGRLAVDTPEGQETAFDDAIWFNPHDHIGWECYDCWLK